MRIMGLDVGARTIGIAVSDPLGLTAQGVKTLRRRSEEADLQELLLLIREYEVERLVVGLPLHMNGDFSESAERALAFGQALAEAAGLPLETEDERLTTVAAERVLLEGNLSRAKRKTVIDKIAAVFILQSYLDRH